MSRKWKITLGVLAVIILFCLWYTRPRSFDDLVGSGEFQNFSLIAMNSGLKNGVPSTDTWQVDSYKGREETSNVLHELLQSCQYRVSLKSLLPFSDPTTIPGEGNTIIHFAVITENGDDFTAIYKGAAATFYADRTIVTRASDPDISEKLLAFVQEYGWKSDS